MKKQNIVIIIVFSALLFGLGLLVWLTPDQDFSENENRYLQKLPELTADTGFFCRRSSSTSFSVTFSM